MWTQNKTTCNLVKRGKEGEQIDRNRQSGNGGRDWSDIATSQEMQATTRSLKMQGMSTQGHV